LEEEMQEEDLIPVKAL
jgi:ubiquitin-protein ligase E3 A